MVSIEPGQQVFGLEKCPPFKLGEARFPQDTFVGRYLHYLDVTDPRTLFASDSKLRSSVALLERYAKGERGDATDAELWEAQKLKQAVLHPDTGDKIFPAFRMSGYVPFGWITVTGMLLPNPGWGSILFWQWANQSHNACVNYANRNATQEVPLSKFLGGYASAVTTACSISAALTYFIKNSPNLSSSTRFFVQRFVPLPATSLASSVNCILMRRAELETGIDVVDHQGTVVGVSRVAAKQALIDTTLTRAFLPIPLLLAPPLIMPFFEKLKSVRSRPLVHLLVNAAVCTVCFGLSLPVALALFPQRGEISVDRLEPDIREKTATAGGASRLYYNKGL